MKVIFKTILILSTVVYSREESINSIDIDPRIMNWSYIGPIKSTKDHKDILDQIVKNGIGNESEFIYNGKSYPIKDAIAGSDANFAAQLYKDIKEDDYLIGFARVFSNNDIEASVS